MKGWVESLDGGAQLGEVTELLDTQLLWYETWENVIWEYETWENVT